MGDDELWRKMFDTDDRIVIDNKILARYFLQPLLQFYVIIPKFASYSIISDRLRDLRFPLIVRRASSDVTFSRHD